MAVNVSITMCLLLLLETFQIYKSSRLYTHKTRSLSMDIHIFQKAIHTIMLIQFRVHSVIIIY